MSIAPPVGRDVSSDEVDLVDDAVGLAGADADEDALVKPVERGATVSIWVEIRKVHWRDVLPGRNAIGVRHGLSSPREAPPDSRHQPLG